MKGKNTTVKNEHSTNETKTYCERHELLW